jgi:hypothetical protein
MDQKRKIAQVERVKEFGVREISLKGESRQDQSPPEFGPSLWFYGLCLISIRLSYPLLCVLTIAECSYADNLLTPGKSASDLFC